MKTNETFEEWFYENHEDLQRRCDIPFLTLKGICSITWNHQQKKIDELGRSVSWLRENCSEWESWGNDLEKVNKSLEAKLTEAVEVLEQINRFFIIGEASSCHEVEELIKQTLAQLSEKGEGE